MTIFIAIEGIDGAGKSLQCELLLAKLERAGLRVVYRSYPQYGEFFGREIGKLLKSEAAGTMDPQSMALWYACDRLKDFERHVRPRLPDADVVLFNRYTLSSAIYQSVRSSDPDTISRWIFSLEHDQFGLPIPDLYIVLDVTTEVALQRNVSKTGRDYIQQGADRYEKDTALQAAARQSYQCFVTSSDNAIIIGCKEFEPRSAESIADVIATSAGAKFGLRI